MILTCEYCDTKFLVSAEQLGEKGRKVRCGTCSHVWFQEAVGEEQVIAEQEIIREQEENLKQAIQNRAEGKEPSLPSVVEPQTVPRWLKVAVGVLIVVNFAVFLILNKELLGQTTFYDVIGQYETRGMVIDSAVLTRSDSDMEGRVHYVDWSIRNLSGTSRKVPAKRIMLLDKNMKVLKKHMEMDKASLKNGESQEMKESKIPNPGNGGRYLVLEIGNPFDLSLRRN